MNTFGTSIHCMDGRIQEPIMNYLKEHYCVDYVDAITEAGPCRILADHNNAMLISSIVERVEISIRKHNSRLIAVSGHHACAGNPCDIDTQKEQIRTSVQFCRDRYPDAEIIGLWIDDEWKVSVV